MSSGQPIYVTGAYLPPLGEVIPLLEEIWASRMVTNGPMHQRFEGDLARFLEVHNLALAAKGMATLGAPIGVWGTEDEVITTPYSLVATTHAVRRSQLERVFVDGRSL